MMLILEYVPYGDLLGYLRKSRGIEDKYYNCPESWQEEVTSYDLLSFAQQIASGMSFLASKKVDASQSVTWTMYHLSHIYLPSSVFSMPYYHFSHRSKH